MEYSFTKEEDEYFLQRLKVIERVNGLELKENQVKHVKRMVQIALRSINILDTSRTGRGKSYTTIALALFFGLKPLVVTTATMVEVWKDLLKKYKIDFIDVLSYQLLASKAGSKQDEKRHLIRIDDEDKERNETSYILTKKGLELQEYGLLVFDEGQNMKNVSDKTKACIALAKAVIPKEGKKTTSRIITLSASLFDKEENAVQFCRVFGYVTKYHKMYDVRDSEFHPLGINELIETAYLFNEKKTEEVVDNVGLGPKTITKLTFNILAKVIFPYISSRMQNPTSEHASLVYNGFFKLGEEESKIYDKAIRSLEKLVVFHDDRILNTKNYMGKIQPILINLEIAKLYIFYRLTTRYLTKTNHKVIICLNYRKSIDAMSEAFKDFEPQILEGEVKPADRKKAIDKFNNDPKTRLLICTPATGGVGISLHDTKGDFPRVMFIVPTYDMIKILQAAGRIDREGKKSDSTVYIVYGQTESKVTEKRILDAIARKTKVLHNVNADVEEVLPGDFPEYIEDEETFKQDL
jgi:hypothetical protein